MAIIRAISVNMNQIPQIVRIVFLILFVFSVSGCKKSTDALSALDYTATAEVLFNEAMITFERERWSDAEKSFGEIRRKYPYSKYAALSEIRGADCLFFLNSHAEAAVSYEHFLKTYPTHPEAAYAAFQRAVSFFEQIPGDFAIMPPSYERDQSATRDARTALSHFLRTYKDTQWQERASELYIEVENALVRHEMYVAEFYLKRKKLKAASVRLEGIAHYFSASPLVPDAMLLQAVTFLEMKETERAIAVFGDIIELFPAHHQAKRAEQYLAALRYPASGAN